MQDKVIRPTTINELAYGVFPSFALLAGMQLKLFTALSPTGATQLELAKALGTTEGKIQALVDPLVVTGLIERESKQLRNSAEAETFLVEGRPQYRGEMAAFYEGLWKASMRTAETIRGGQPAARLDFAEGTADELMAFFRRQYPSSLLAGQEVCTYGAFGRYTHLADIGGGTGGTSISICTAVPTLSSTVYELPTVVPVARAFVAEAGMGDRIGARALDITGVRPEGDHDVALLRSVLQVMDEASAQLAVHAAFALLRPGGDLLIVGSVLQDSRRGPASALARGLVFLNVYESGQSYTERQHRVWLTEAGFVDIQVDYACMRDGTSAVRARRPDCSLLGMGVYAD